MKRQTFIESLKTKKKLNEPHPIGCVNMAFVTGKLDTKKFLAVH